MMSIDLKKYDRLKTKAERLQREADRAEGALEQLMYRLESEHGVNTLADAEKLLKRREREAAKAESEFGDALEAFEGQWGEVLDEVPR